MHLRILARADCSGGTCPAVYSLDEQPGDYVVQGRQADASLLGKLTGVAPDETAVIISRALVGDALRPAAVPVSADEFAAQFSRFSYSAFRLETYQQYEGTGPAHEWAALVKRNCRWGKTHQRVHVITEPLTSDMQEELTDGYEPNVAAGEDIRIIHVAGEDEWPAEVPRFDFWLFDSCQLYLMHYTPGGAWTGADRITDPERIVEACLVRDAALHRAVPWRAYIASRPDLERRLAQ